MTYFLRNKALENFSQMFALTGESFEYAGTLNEMVRPSPQLN